MTTNEKIELCMVGSVLLLITGVYGYFAKRIDDRSEAEHQAYMKTLEVVAVNNDSTDE